MAEWEMSCVGDGKPGRGGHYGRGRYCGKCGLKGQLDFYKGKVFLAYCLGPACATRPLLDTYHFSCNIIAYVHCKEL